MYRTALPLLLVVAVWGLSPAAQTPATDAGPPVHADLNQLMRGILYPAANVVFFAQAENPAELKFVPGHDPNMSTDPLTSTFGGWVAVENAALALAESATLLAIAGRRCSNGVAVPVKDPAWVAFVQDVRTAGMKAYAAARAKDQGQIVEAADPLNASCVGCHRKFRDRKARELRCTPA
jgi:hypothetical protein